MENRIYQLEAEMELKFDSDSPEFQNAFESYKAVVNNDGNKEDMLKYVARNLIRFGVESMVEGVGYVQHENYPPVKEGWCGITVDDDDPDFEISAF